ncbi:putative endoglucanase [Tuber indicum]|nr:putative endoglucanase [Tuber indicum]
MVPLALALTTLTLLRFTSAHLAIKDPKPLHYNDLGGADFYSSPLREDDWGASVAQWSAGGAGTFTIDILGVAAHNGGSCQASISYDAGRTFKVLKSFIGDCPRGAVENNLFTTEQTFDFPISANAPRGSALFAWTWFTVTGFRQMYMNCAHVEIIGAGAGSGEAEWPVGMPDMFIGETNQCKTQEFGNLYFPDPGSAVQFGGKTNWVNAGPVGVCNIPSDMPPNALMPGRKARVARMLKNGVEVVKRAFDGGTRYLRGAN